MTKIKSLSLILFLVFGYFLGQTIIKQAAFFTKNKQVLKALGIHQTETIGFLPYWLVATAQSDYSSYLSNISYFGLAVDGDGTIYQKSEPGYQKLTDATLNQKLTLARQKGLTTSLVLYAADTTAIDEIITHPDLAAKNLLAAVLPIMQQYHYTDLNIDLETLRVATPAEQQAFTQFLTLVSQNIKTNDGYTLTICLPVPAFSYDTIISPQQIQPLVDRVVVMTYDYYYRGSAITGPTAPYDEVKSALNSALATFRSSQIILGLPLYSYTWETLKNIPGSPIIPGSGQTLTAIQSQELLANCSNCQSTANPQTLETAVVYPDEASGSFHQTSIPSDTNFAAKIDLVKTYNLAGVAFWALGYEPINYLSPFSSLKSYSWLD